MKPSLTVVPKVEIIPTVPQPVAVRLPNSEYRTREYLTPVEVEKLVEEAKRTRWPVRDATAVMVAFYHGLRANELVDLRWSQVDLAANNLHCRRSKGGTASVHEIYPSEFRALKKLRKEVSGDYLFMSERGGPCTVAWFQKLVERLGEKAQLGFQVHAHMLRHACGYALANQGHDTRKIQAYLGHKSIASTVIYTALSPAAFKDFFR
jgi:integrase